ncbi:MAG: hypothetical protein GX442_14800 [Candidatus Riflebacteria bacterium]|nr:hypothetical protein [Candidatus Riflebacteria bacterium]
MNPLRASLPLLFGMALALAAPCFGAGFSLPYGAGEHQVGFVNETTAPDQELLNPLGPLSFRVVGGTCWVLDTVNGRLHHLAADGKPMATIALPARESADWQDFAVTVADGRPAAFYVLDGAEQQVLRLSATGEVQGTFGGLGEEPGKFVQVFRIEVDAAGNMYVADRGRQVVSVLSPAGKVLREIDWEWSGFCLDPSGNLCYLRWDEDAGVNHLVVETLAGKSVRSVPLAIGPHFNPDLWRVEANGETVVSFNLPEGAPNQMRIARCGADGKVIAGCPLTPPKVMNRFLDWDGATCYLGVADYGEAPKGTFAVEPFPWK